jgi:hypothetical protein
MENFQIGGNLSVPSAAHPKIVVLIEILLGIQSEI